MKNLIVVAVVILALLIVVVVQAERYIVPDRAYTLPVDPNDSLFRSIPMPTTQELIKWGNSERTAILRLLIRLAVVADAQGRALQDLQERVAILEKANIADPNTRESCQEQKSQ